MLQLTLKITWELQHTSTYSIYGLQYTSYSIRLRVFGTKIIFAYFVPVEFSLWLFQYDLGVSCASRKCQLVCGKRILSCKFAPLRSWICRRSNRSVFFTRASQSISREPTVPESGPQSEQTAGIARSTARLFVGSAGSLLLPRRTRRRSRRLHAFISQRLHSRGSSFSRTYLTIAALTIH